MPREAAGQRGEDVRRRCTIYFPILKRVQQGDGSWGPLSRRQQRQMDEVVRLWEGAAEQGRGVSEWYNLGIMYNHGRRGCELQEGDRVVREGGGAGTRNAQYNLGVMYKNGHGVDVNYKKAIEWYEKAAKQGDANAQYNLGVMYHHGHGVDVNYKKAIEWYEKAAKQGYADAQYNLGLMYHHGQGVDVNYKKAIEWYEKAAEQGDAQAQYNLGIMYDHGQGVDVNYKKAIEWYEKAAEQGLASAQYNLGKNHVPSWPRRGCELQEGDRVVREGGEAGTRPGSV